MCLYPRLMKNKKYLPNKKNGGNAPVPVDKRVLAVSAGCGKCIECRKQKARQWQARLSEEIIEDKKGKFVTLTFSNESLKELAEVTEGEGYEKDNNIAKKAVRRFLERWRKKWKKSVKHWLIPELGHEGTERLHIHGIIWTDEIKDISEIWKYGYVRIGTYINEESIGYITKYITKKDEKHKNFEARILSSSGIGEGFSKGIRSKINKYKIEGTEENYINKSGRKIAMPMYWRNKIYSDEEREKLWLEKLDKEERWVMGVKIDISNGMENYYRALKDAREKNIRLGYGSDGKNWKEEEYEGMRRKMQLDKITKA